MNYVEIALKRPFREHKWRKGFKGGSDLDILLRVM